MPVPLCNQFPSTGKRPAEKRASTIEKVSLRGSKNVLTCLLAVAAGVAQTNVAPPSGRRALLIGNCEYKNLPRQSSPFANVRLLGPALTKAGFAPRILENVSQTQMKQGIQSFLDGVEPRDFVFFYFSGYGYQEDDGNYLVPIDFDPKDTDSPAGSKAYSLALLLRQLDSHRAGAKMIVLDASRPCKGAPGQCRGLSEGLAQPQQLSLGTLLAFPAPPNQPLEDPGTNENPFTSALARAIVLPGANPRGVLDAVQEAASAQSKQLPFVAATVVPPFYFVDPPKTEPERVVVTKIVKAEVKPGETRVNAKDLLVYNWIPPGKFQMGCVPDDSDCKLDENPRHEVTISKGFWITSTEVTAEAYSRFASQTGHPDAKPSQLGHKGLATDVPVINVTWDDANAYCAYVGGLLPAEAQWEYAARGGNPNAVYPWGPWDPTKADFFETVTNGKYRKTIAPYSETVPVHKFRAVNGYGLFGMAGNASEWVADYYSPSAYAEAAAADPPGPATGKERVVRGGSWNDPQKYLRITARDHHAPDKPENTIGFRCVMPTLGDN